MKLLRKRVIKFILVCVVFVGFVMLLPQSTQAASGVPSIDAKASKNNVLKLLAVYDKDGAYILKKQIAKGDKIMRWFPGGSRIIDCIGTAVHEETHAYSYSHKKKKAKAYFVGKKKTVYVPQTKVYKTKKMAKSIPGSLRTFRYDMYIARPAKNLSSNVEGAYGLLNEFMAYRTGMNTTVSLYPYYAGQEPDWDVWSVYIRDCENGKLAYAEFKYYILHYLSYAKKHHPKVYNGIIKNKKFCLAYRRIESSYVKLIKQYEKDLIKMQKLMADRGYEVRITDDEIDMFYNGYGIGTGRYSSDYKKLQKELGKSKYKTIHKKLVKNR